MNTFDRAKQAIADLFNDTTVSHGETLDRLESVSDEIEAYIRVLDETHPKRKS